MINNPNINQDAKSNQGSEDEPKSNTNDKLDQNIDFVPIPNPSPPSTVDKAWSPIRVLLPTKSSNRTPNNLENQRNCQEWETKEAKIQAQERREDYNNIQSDTSEEGEENDSVKGDPEEREESKIQKSVEVDQLDIEEKSDKEQSVEKEALQKWEASNEIKQPSKEAKLSK